jgi:hypothetical protein
MFHNQDTFTPPSLLRAREEKFFRTGPFYLRELGGTEIQNTAHRSFDRGKCCDVRVHVLAKW